MVIIDMKKIKDIFFNNSIVRFILVGGTSTGIDFIIYMILSQAIPLAASKAISMIVASIFSYVANKRFTFKDKDKTNLKYILRYYFVFAINLGANVGMNYMMFRLTGSKIVAFIFATVCGMTVNYLGQRFIVFNRNREE